MAAETQQPDDLLSQDLASEAELAQMAEMRAAYGSSPHLEAAATFPEVMGDNNVLRFLRGNNHDVGEAGAKFAAMLEWRAANGANAMRERMAAAAEAAGATADNLAPYCDPTLLPHADKVMRYYSERQYHGRDARGNPVMITQNGFICHIDALMRHVTADEFWEYRLARNELRAMLLEQLSQQQGRLVKITFVWDLDGMGLGYWKKLSSPPVKAYRRDFEASSRDHYPEIAFKVVAINVPWFVNMLWKGIKTMLNPRTLAKISISSANYDAALQEVVPVEQLPAHLHGSCETPPPGWRPDLALAPGEGDEEGDAPGEAVTVPAGSSHAEERPLKAGETAMWEFTVAAHDVGYCAAFAPAAGDADAEAEEVAREDRVLAGGLVRGSHEAAADGVLTVTWDNSYSRFRSKTVHFTFDVLPATPAGPGLLRGAQELAEERVTAG